MMVFYDGCRLVCGDGGGGIKMKQLWQVIVVVVVTIMMATGQ